MKNELLSRIIKNSPTKNTSILSESFMFHKKDVIPTDIPIINVAFSGDIDGGLSSGLTLLAGPSRNFKSMLALICVKAFLDKYDGSVCILYDSEGGITPEYLRTMNIDPNRVVHIPIEHIEMLKFDLVKQLKEINREDKVIILIDSIGNTASLKELEDALNEKSVAEMQRAKSIKGLFRMVTPSFIVKDIPCIAVCHTYSEMCLDGDTLIKIPGQPSKKIKDVVIGDQVYGTTGIQKVINTYSPKDLSIKDKTFYELSFDDGSVVKCTNNHRFLLNDQWIQADSLKIGDVFD